MKKLDIIYEDKNILAVNKPSKLLCISDGKTDNTLYSMARNYVKKKHKSNKVFIVHRLDKDTSGVVVFAKDEKTKKHLQDNWNSITKRQYVGILDGVLKTNSGVIEEYLKENSAHFVYATHDKSGEYAKTCYKVTNTTSKNTAVDIEIKTGKKHQIRVAFSNLGYPIIGDKKYGSKNDPIKRLGLHAYKLTIKYHDGSLTLKARLPKEFKNFMKILDLSE